MLRLYLASQLLTPTTNECCHIMGTTYDTTTWCLGAFPFCQRSTKTAFSPSCCHLLDICAQPSYITLVHQSLCTTMWRACPVAIMPLPSLAIIVHIYSTSISPPICNPATLGLESHNPKHVFLIFIQHSTYSCSLARASTHAT